MLSFKAITGVLAVFIGITSATPSFTASDFEITQLSTHQPNGRGNLTQDVTLSFLVHDPDPLTNSSAHCSGAWNLNGTYPTGSYIPCSNSSFGWNFVEGSFQNIYTFTLQIEHNFIDDAVGEAPYNRITNFAKASVSRNVTNCASVHHGTHKGEYNCHQKDNSTIIAPIWASTAK